MLKNGTCIYVGLNYRENVQVEEGNNYRPGFKLTGLWFHSEGRKEEGRKEGRNQNQNLICHCRGGALSVNKKTQSLNKIKIKLEHI